MKQSKYNYIVNKKDTHIIFNAISGSVFCADKDFKNRFEKGNLLEDEIGALYKMGFLVDDDCNEFARIIECNKINNQNQDNKFFTICPTTNCNARCFYCFENNKKHCVMTKEIADKTIEFIVNDVINSNAKCITINWFGGEPLLGQSIIDHITKGLKSNKELMNKVDFSANITTNGILITEEVIKKFDDWHIHAVQITLDGYGKTYEERKAYCSEPNAFKKIIEILKSLLNKKINVSIRLNYDDQNIKSILKLIDFLDVELNAEQKQHVQTYPAKLEYVQSCSVCNTQADKNYLKILKKLHKANICKNFKQLNLKYRFAHCLVNSEYNYIIGASGDIYKCNEHVDEKDHKVGSVFEGIKRKNELNTEYGEDCKNCKFFPICQGGCPQHRGDSFAKCQIEKYVLEDILKLYIK